MPTLAHGLAEDQVLHEMVQRLVAAIGPERIYLFGSRARGDHRQESDYDLLIVVAEASAPGYRRDQQAFRALRGLSVAKDVLVMTRAEFDARRFAAASLPALVEREGMLLYAA